MTTQWNWKNKDGSTPGLLYESGNWGDLLKMLWLRTVLSWKRLHFGTVNYIDLFAGDVAYPLTPKARHRIRQTGFNHFNFLLEDYLKHDLWPSAASGARFIVNGKFEIFDADTERRGKWENTPNTTILNGDSGWDILASQQPDPQGIWLVDPYDFLAEWREHLPMLVEKSRTTTILLYLYNRSAKNESAFKNYRDFKNALEDLNPGPKRLGRVPADPFLPRSHHEIMFLASDGDTAHPAFIRLLDDLAIQAYLVSQGLSRVAACEA